MSSLETGLVDPIHGFHPTLKTIIIVNIQPSTCGFALLYRQLSPNIIIDKYQLRTLFDEARLVDPPVESASLLHDLLVWGNPDLEAPASFVDPEWHSGLLIPLTGPRNASRTNLTITAALPFHFRYLEPVAFRGSGSMLKQVSIKPPSLVSVCDAQTAERSLSASSTRRLSEDPPVGLLPDHLSLHEHLLPLGPPIQLKIPVGHQADEQMVELITAATFWIALVWIGRCIFQAHWHSLKREQASHGGER